MAPKIDKPIDSRINVFKGSKAGLYWHADFYPKWSGRYNRAQQFVDSEIIRYSEPFTPLRTGMLIKSGTLGTHPGSGLVAWIAIYARRQYYAARKPGSETGPLRGPFWFERMRKQYGKAILAGARRIAGGGYIP